MTVVRCKQCGAINRVDEIRLAAGEAKCGRCGTKLERFSNSDKPYVVTDSTFQNEVLKTNGPPVLVDAWAPWCGPCRIIGPILDQLAAESQGRYRIAKLNVDENPQVASQYQISSIPTLMIFKNGQLIDRLIGAYPKEVIAERLSQALK